MSSNALCKLEDSCLVLIDIQERLTAAIPTKVIERLRANTSVLLQAANQLKIPVIATEQYPQGLGKIEGYTGNHLNNDAVIIEKTCFSCLGSAEFNSHLKRLNKKQIVIVGIEAHICVLQSAFEFQAAGFDVFVLTDGIASRKLTSYESAIMRMNQGGINIVNTESVLFEWLRDAAHPEFKTLSKLIV